MLATQYAGREVVVTILLGALVTVLAAWWAGWWALVPAVLTLALLAFYRDPPRRVPANPACLMAPADGRVVRITRNAATPDGPQLQIMIFLSVLDVHINRSPCAGEVLDVQYRPGKFLNALKAEADEQNEANALTLRPAGALPGPLIVRQVAGILARRIVCRAAAGDPLAAGERFGMIKLGSRTELRAPEDARWEVLVREGEHVSGGRTVLVRLRTSPPAELDRA